MYLPDPAPRENAETCAVKPSALCDLPALPIYPHLMAAVRMAEAPAQPLSASRNPNNHASASRERGGNDSRTEDTLFIRRFWVLKHMYVLPTSFLVCILRLRRRINRLVSTLQSSRYTAGH